MSQPFWPHGLYSPPASLPASLHYILYHWATREAHHKGTVIKTSRYWHKIWINRTEYRTQKCLTLFQPHEHVHGISQARILEWVAISFSRGTSWPRDWTHISCITGRFFTTEPLGKPSIVSQFSTKNTRKYNGVRQSLQQVVLIKLDSQM